MGLLRGVESTDWLLFGSHVIDTITLRIEREREREKEREPVFEDGERG